MTTSQERLDRLRGAYGEREARGMGDSEKRLARLRGACAAGGMDAFYVRDTSNIRWLTGFDGVFDEERAHALLVTQDAVALHTDSRYAEAALAAAGGTGVEVDVARMTHAAFAAERMRRAAERSDARTGGVPKRATLGIEDAITLAEYRQLQRAFGEKAAGTADAGVPDAAGVPGAPHAIASGGTVGPGGVPDALGAAGAASVEDAGAASAPGGGPAGVASACPGLPLRETSDVVLGLRAVKDAGEIARMRAAQAVADAAFAHIVSFMRPGMTERAVQVELEGYMRRHGADDLAFPSIVAAGANGASPHAVPGDTVLEAGQCVVLDFGAKARGYCSDMTRTVFLGEPDARLRSAYETLRRANEQVERALRPGVTGKEMHELAERVLDEGGFGGLMGHGLGHGVGLDIHELPNLSPRNEAPLMAGNVVTVEPGIYVPGEFGMRLEDFGVVTEEGFQVFTQSTHDMVII